MMKEDYITIHTNTWYDAAHHLNDYEGACANLHGHTYRIDVWIKGNRTQLDKSGILWDFGNLKKATKEFDHAGNTTEIMKMNSTAENQCRWFYDKFKKQNPNLNFKVRVYEQVQPKESWAECGDFE